MKRLRYFVFLDDGTYNSMDDVEVLIAQDTREFSDFMDNDPKIRRIDDECPSTYYVTIPISDLLDAFLEKNPNALQDLKEKHDPDSETESPVNMDDYPPKEWDVPGSADFVLTHQHGGENVESDDEPDEAFIMEKYAHPLEKSYACTHCGLRFGGDEDAALRHTDSEHGMCAGYEYESVE